MNRTNITLYVIISGLSIKTTIILTSRRSLLVCSFPWYPEPFLAGRHERSVFLGSFDIINPVFQLSLSTFSWRKPSVQRIKQPGGKRLSLPAAEVRRGPDVLHSSRPRILVMDLQWGRNGACNRQRSDETLISLNPFTVMIRPEGWGIVRQINSFFQKP